MIIDTATYRQSAPTQAAKVPAAAPPASPVPAARRSRRWFLAAACATYLIVLLAVYFTMRLEGDRWWVATVLLLAPRWPLALPLLVLWPWSLVARRWGAIAATGAAPRLVLFPRMGPSISPPRGSAGRGPPRPAPRPCPPPPRGPGATPGSPAPATARTRLSKAGA